MRIAELAAGNTTMDPPKMMFEGREENGIAMTEPRVPAIATGRAKETPENGPDHQIQEIVDHDRETEREITKETVTGIENGGE